MKKLQNNYLFCHKKKNKNVDFPGGPVVRNPPASAGDIGSIPSLGRFYMLWAAKPMCCSY